MEENCSKPTTMPPIMPIKTEDLIEKVIGHRSLVIGQDLLTDDY